MPNIAINILLIVSTLVLFGIIMPIVDKVQRDYATLQMTLKHG